MSMATARKLVLTSRRRLTAQAMLKHWEQEFRADFEVDGGARFEALLERFGIRTGSLEMLEGTVDMVTACAAFSSMDGAEIDALLADQHYDGQASTGTYALTFDLLGRSSARLLVRPDMKTIDLADLFEYPWERLRAVGYSDFWITRLDGEDLSMEEVEELDRVVCRDLRFDYTEDQVSINFDPETHAGALSITIYEQIEDLPNTEATKPEAA